MMVKYKILVCVAGGVAAYKVVEFVRMLMGAGHNVRVIMTKNAERFVTRALFEAVTGQPVYSQLFSNGGGAGGGESGMMHIDLVRWADKLVVMPATASIIGKIANGVCDDLVSTVVVASCKRAYIVPSMNVEMWLNPAVQRNIQLLRSDGHYFVGPVSGEQACGDNGVGRMMEPSDVCNVVLELGKVDSSNSNALKGVDVVITMGSIREAIDPVRYIGNHSSGKMGGALVDAFVDLGANVTAIVGHTSCRGGLNDGDSDGGGMVRSISVNSVDDMLKRVRESLTSGAIFVSVAAIPDYRVASYSSSKIKKDGADSLQLELVKNVDILEEISLYKRDKDIFTVGFALESENVVENALAKLKKKDLNMIIANRIGDDHVPFDSDYNEVVIIDERMLQHFVKMDEKRVVAAKIVDAIQRCYRKRIIQEE